jgi:hypothetical protein
MIASMPKKRGPARPRPHGGRREGAGRKPLEGVGTQVVAVRLTPKNVDQVERYMDAHGLPNFSAAVRAMIELASAHEPG